MDNTIFLPSGWALSRTVGWLHGEGARLWTWRPKCDSWNPHVEGEKNLSEVVLRYHKHAMTHIINHFNKDEVSKETGVL